MTTKSAKHSNKAFGSEKDKAAKAVDIRKVAALSVGAAGVIAGAAIAFGATPAMAAEATSTPVDPSAPANTQDVTAKNDDSKKKVDEKQQADNQNQQAEVKKQADQTVVNAEGAETNKETTDNAPAPSSAPAETNTYAASSTPAEVTTGSNNGQDRAATPAPAPKVNSEITISKETKDMLPNMYAWGSTDNTYSKAGQNQSIKFKLQPADGIAVTKVAIFPNDNIDISNKNAQGFAEYNSADPEWHRPYSGNYAFKTDSSDGTATLTMTALYRDNNMPAAGYAANRCIYVYGMKDGKEVLLYKTNIARAATIVPPKKTGSFVLRYDQKLEESKIQEKLKEALDAPTELKDKNTSNPLSVRDQITAASQAHGVGVRDKDNEKKLDTTPDTAENKVIINADQAYDANQLATVINKETSKSGEPKTYVTGVYNLKTYLVSDLGYKSDVLPLTIARYDTRIDKPTVEDPTNVSQEVKNEIIKKLAQLNHVAQDKVSINDKGEVTINFEGVDAADAPKIALRDLVLKKIAEADVTVPTGDKATFVYNPLAYSDAEIKSIKKSIFEANKDNKELGLTSVDQISLEYLTGNLTQKGKNNQGISNGRQENTITVKIKTDKAVAEFTSDVTKSKLTKFVNIREDYDVTWDASKNKIENRDSDEGLSWSEDHKTIIYRYDPTKAVAFKSSDVTKLLTATPKAGKEGLRTLTGGEKLDHEGAPGQEKKSHVGYILQNGQPTGELTLGIMKSGYWTGDPQITGTDVNMGDVLAKADSYTWNDGAEPVKVASKDGKIYRARLFVAPYGMESYQYVYTHPDGKNPNNTSKAINVIFVPQTNHKTKDLKKSVEDHKTVPVEGKDVPTQHEYYNASKDKKDAYDKALQTAKTLYESVKDTEESKLTEDQKAQIDNATINLNKARAELDGANTDKNGLDKSITEDGKPAQGQTPASGTQATDRYKNVTDPDFKTDDGKPDTTKNDKAKAAKKAYDEALQAAKELKDDANATQKDVDAAKAKLDAARAKLNDFTTSKDKLNAAIAEHGKAKYVEDAQGAQTLAPAYQNATDDERTAYDDAVKKANELAKDPNASQKEVNAAIEALEAAKKALDAKATDKSKLITAEKLSFDNPDPDKTDGKKSTFYKNAFDKQTSGDNDQEKQAAKTAVDNYNNALKKAREVLKNDKATQAEVDAAKEALTNAEKVLHEKYASNADELTKVLADNFSGYLMPAYFNAFDKAHAGDKDAAAAFKNYNDAYHKAKELKKNFEATDPSKQPTATDIADAKKALEEARKVIDKYATNTSRLSAAVFNDIAIQHSPAYANVKELADKQNPSEEEKAQVEAAKKAKEAYEAAVAKLNQALNKQMPKDKQGNTEIPTSNTPDKDGNPDSGDYLKNIQAHAQGEPLDRDITKILKEMNAAADELNKFATKTDELLKSVNEDDATKHTPAYKNASLPVFQKADSSDADADKNAKAKQAVDKYGEMLNKAKELLKDPNATQAQINEAKKNLDDARKTLLGDPNDQANVPGFNTDTTKLQKSVGEHGKEKQGDTAAKEGTVTSDAYRNASDPHFMKEKDGKLVPDDTKNNAAKEAKKKYDEALTKAQELLKKHDDSNTPQDAKPTQKDINDALDALDKARTKLDTYKTDTTKLDAEAKKSTADGGTLADTDFESTPEFKNADDQKGEGNKDAASDVKTYKDALKKARDLVKAATETGKKNSERPTQKEVNDALDALTAAKKQITDNYKTNLEALAAAKDYAGGDFKNTPEYQNAVAKKDAGDQGAKKDLGEAGQDTGFDNVLKNVTDKLNDEDWKKKATQEQVEALLKQLQDAQDKITDNYKTNADKLKNEVGDKDEKGKDVIPPFEASVPYKNALAKADAGDNDATTKLNAYNEKLKAAQDLINKVNNPDPNAKPEDRPTQAKVDAALTELKNAKDAITNGFKTDVTALQKEVDDKDATGNVKDPTFENTTEYKNLQGKTKDGKKPDDLVAYEQALAKAKELIDKNDGKVTKDGQEVDVPKDQLPTQQEVDEAKKALKEIKDKIIANYKTNPHDLQEEFNQSKDGDDDTRTDVFENTPEFKNAQAKGDDASKQALKDYNDKREAAKKLLDKFDRSTGKLKQGETAPTQKELDEALDALQAAKKKITDGYKTDPSKLKSEADADGDFAKTPEFQNAVGSPEADAYKKALDEANKVLGDKDATQAQVDEALKKLQQAKEDLVSKHKTDKDKLYQEKGNDPEFRKSIPFLIADNKDIAEYNKALNEANDVLNNPNATQAQVDEALRKLQRIKQKMIDFYNSLGSGSSDDDSDGNNNGNNGADNANANANAVDKSMLHAEVNGALTDIANGAGTKVANGVDASVVKELNDALENARRVLADPNATREQVEAATMRLRAAREAFKAAVIAQNDKSRGSMGVQTGVDSATLSAFAAMFVGLAGLGVSAKRRKHAR